MRNRVTLILLVSLIGLAAAPARGAENEKIFPLRSGRRRSRTA